MAKYKLQLALRVTSLVAIRQILVGLILVRLVALFDHNILVPSGWHLICHLSAPLACLSLTGLT